MRILKLQKVIYKLEYFALIFIKLLINRLPQSFKKYLLNFLVFIFYFVIKKYKKIVKKNLEIVFGKNYADKNYKNITKLCLKNLLLNIFSVIENIDRTSDDIANIVKFENREIVDNLLKEKKSFIFSSGHFNNWELLVTAVASQISFGFGVAEELKNPFINKVLMNSREKFRIKVIPMKGALRQLIKAIKGNYPIFVIMDQAVNIGQGVEKDFFNFSAIHSDINRFLSEKYDLYIIPTYIHFEDNKYKIKFEEPFKSSEVEDSLGRELEILENKIKSSPENWLWCHRRWKNHKDIYN